MIIEISGLLVNGSMEAAPMENHLTTIVADTLSWQYQYAKYNVHVRGLDKLLQNWYSYNVLIMIHIWMKLLAGGWKN